MSTHPSYERLQAFGLGFEIGTGSAELEAHVAECPECARVLESLAGDTLIGLLQEASTLLPGPPQELGGSCGTVVQVPPELADHPRYRVLQLLGTGGMGAVFKAEHRLMERTVALKVVQPSLLSRPDAVERFNREVRAAARLSHPNIVTAYDAERAGTLHFLVTEFVDGNTLAQIVSESGPMQLVSVVDYAGQAARGLQHAYERGMVHRDVKPQNMIVTPSGQLKILDFGLARFVSDARTTDAITEPGALMGTPDYLAPEQARGPHQADIRADIYGLGCTLYFLLAGHPPYPEGTVIEKVMAHIERTPKPLDEIRSDIPGALVEIISRMMATNPTSRYSTPAEVLQALEELQGSMQQAVPVESRDSANRQVSSGTAGTGSRFHWLLASGGLAAALIMAGTYIAISKDRTTGDSQSEISNNAATHPMPDSEDAPRVVAVWVKDGLKRRFVARADLDRDAFHAQSDECQQDGLRPLCINGYSGERGDTLFAGLWIDDEPATPYIAKHDLDSRGLQRHIHELPKGYYPIWLDTYGLGSARRFAVISVNDGRNVSWQAASRLGVEASQQAIDEMTAKGFRSSIVSGHTGPTGVPHMTFTFVQESTAFRVFLQLPFDKLKEAVDKLPAGWQPIWIDAYPAESSRRYALIGAEQPEQIDWRFSSAPTIEEYQFQFEEQLRDGFRPLLISVD